MPSLWKADHIAFDCWHRFDQEFQCPQSQNMHNQPPMSAMVSVSYSAFDTTWYPDSGATNNLTPTLARNKSI